MPAPPTFRQGSLTHPLEDPDAELAAARAEVARARDRLERHTLRPGGPDPHTYWWLDAAQRREAAALERVAARPAAASSWTWSDEELLALVTGYREASFTRDDPQAVLATITNRLPGRSAEDVRYRLGSIAAVLEEMGHPYLEAFPPRPGADDELREVVLRHLVGTSRDGHAPPGVRGARVFQVNQTISAETDRGILCASDLPRGGWLRLREMRPGDVILHNVRAAIRAISLVAPMDLADERLPRSHVREVVETVGACACYRGRHLTRDKGMDGRYLACLLTTLVRDIELPTARRFAGYAVAVGDVLAERPDLRQAIEQVLADQDGTPTASHG